MMSNPKNNTEGYPEPTAYEGSKRIIKEEAEIEKKAFDLIKVLKFIIRASGFELVERIKIKDVKSRREFR